jgi:archaellum component FlaC
MITSKIAANQAFAQVNRMHKVDDASRQHHGRDEAIKTTKGETIDGIKAEISSFSLNPSHQFNTEFNAVVKSIRIADKAMGEIETNIEQMESEVEMFLKQYPPFHLAAKIGLTI